MTLHKALFVIVFSFFFSNVFSQTDFRPGYYINLNSDTIYGLLDYRGDIRNSKMCVFKKDEDDESIKFEPHEIKGYRFIDSKFYISRVVKTRGEEKLFFVEYLVNGIADLFYYEDVAGGHYLIKTKSGDLIELKKEKEQFYMEGKGEVVRETNKHIGILKATFADCMEVQTQIDRAQLNHKSLITITKNYHDYVCNGEKCIIYEKKIPFLKVRLSPFIGVGVSNYKLENSAYNFENSISPTGGAGIQIIAPRFSEKISLLFNFGLRKDYYYSFYHEENIYSDIHIHSLFLNSIAGLKYTYPKGKLKPTFACGISFLNSLNSSKRVIEETVNYSVVLTDESGEIPFPATLFGGFAQFGCNYSFSEKLKGFINLSYLYNKGEIFQYPYNYSVLIQSVNMSIGLYF